MFLPSQSLHVCVYAMGEQVGGHLPLSTHRATVRTTYTIGYDCPLQIIPCEVLCVEQEQHLETEHSGPSPPSAPAVTSAHPRTSVSPSDKWEQINLQKDSDVPSAPGTKEILKAWSSFPRTARQAPAHIRLFRPDRVETLRNRRLTHPRGQAGRPRAKNQSTAASGHCLQKCHSVWLQCSLCQRSQ